MTFNRLLANFESHLDQEFGFAKFKSEILKTKGYEVLTYSDDLRLFAVVDNLERPVMRLIYRQGKTEMILSIEFPKIKNERLAWVQSGDLIMGKEDILEWTDNFFK